jgi:hypothetical protein
VTREVCQAQALDFGLLESVDDPVPPCDGPQEVELRGFRLCAPCAEALELYLGITLRVTKDRSE